MLLNDIQKHISESEIEKSSILKIIFTKFDRPVVFLPNYGEFGSTVVKLIKIVHFVNAPKKIVCCKKGEECYFPNANEFFYEWDDFVEDEHKWGFFTKKSPRHSTYKKMLSKDFEKIKNHFGDQCHYIHLWKFNIDKIFNKYHHYFTFKLCPKIKNNISADVIISPRNKMSRKENNFLQWEQIISELNKKSYTVGCVGSKDQSITLKNNYINSWDYEDNSSAVIELLSNCKLYLGLDTGVSHLAAFMSVPMIVFSHSNQKHYLTNFMKEINKNYFKDLGKNIKNTEIIIEKTLNFLEKEIL